MKTKTNQTTRTEQNQRNGHHTEGFQWGGGREEWGGKYQGEEAWLVGIRQTGRDKKWHGKQRTQRIYMYNPRMWTKGEGMLEDWGGSVEGGQEGKIGSWDGDWRSLEGVCGFEGVENSNRTNYTLCHLKQQEDQFHTFDDFKQIYFWNLSPILLIQL